jgi:NADPH:quinone reductase-like Zn-dependent oxidoreductase
MRFAKGDRVFVRVDKDVVGTFAEYAMVHEDHAARMPASLDFPSAAAVPLTALQALRDELQLSAGGVGTFAIQIAKQLGAHVATTTSPRGEALVNRLGADVVIDYLRERFEDKLSGYDCALDLVGADTLRRLWPVVKPGGRVFSIAGIPEPVTARKDLGRGRGLAWTGLAFGASATSSGTRMMISMHRFC